jgi:osmotically-inducible protein OsmY
MERTQTMGKKTTDIRAAVDDELVFDPLVDSAGITVANAGGDVVLNGTVPSYPQYLEAADAARRVAGVTGVHNHLEVVLAPGDYRDDPLLATTASNALEVNLTVPGTVGASAHHGNIILTGTVRYGSQRAAAESAVATLTGVRSVRDDIEVSCDDGSADVLTAVRDALDRHALIPGDSDVLVESTGNTVTLTGHVATWAEHDAVLNCAWMTPAVCDVRDGLVVTGWPG